MRIPPPHASTVLVASAAVSALAACGSDGTLRAFPQPCQGPVRSGEALYLNAEVEPSLAVDPANAAHLLGVWQQDRFSLGGANGLLASVSFDNGRTWTTSSAAFSRCTGGTVANGGNYERASDPWASISPDGTAHQLALSFDSFGGRRAILASRSADGGRTWSAPAPLQVDTDPSFALDKGSITADPKDASMIYAVWDRLTQANVLPTPSTATGPTWFARSTNGGQSWEPARSIYDPGADAQTIGNIVAVATDGTLLNVTEVITCNSNPNCFTASISVLRSSDNGVTWSTTPVAIQRTLQTADVLDTKTQRRIRFGGALPSIAVDASNGVVYAVWTDSFNGGKPPDGIALSHSADAGQTWSKPIQVNSDHAAQAFTPVVSAGGGRVAVSYYDTRNDNPVDTSHFLVSAWLVVSTDQGATWQETALAGPFDLHTAPFAEGFFLGDYEGLAWDGTSFLAYFAAANSGNAADPTSILFRRVP